MADSYKDAISSSYQLPEDTQPAQSNSIDVELVDYISGLPLVDEETKEQLVGVGQALDLQAANGTCTPVLVANDEKSSVPVETVSQNQSEVSKSLLGVPKTERAEVLFDAINIYGVNRKEWQAVVSYTYNYDPLEHTFDENYGFYARHITRESAIQAYAYPPPKSYVYPPPDDGTGRYPGGYTNGVMQVSWESRRAFRYQPGRISGFTMGVKVSTGSGHPGELIRWGCRNQYGDGYYFQLEAGVNLAIVRTSPGLGELKTYQKDWNGDKVLVGDTQTGWTLDLSKVTMFKIEFSWYGAIGATFFAYIPVNHDEGRWVKLHQISAENQFTQPSLRSPYMKFFTSVRAAAGTTKAAFINLYGSSVYIDGGDRGTITLGSAALTSPKAIDSNSRSILGLYLKDTINDVINQKAVYPVSLAAYSSVAARFDLVLQSSSCGGLQYGYGNGMVLSRGLSSSISVIRTGSRTLRVVNEIDQFPDFQASDLNGSIDYLSGRRVRVVGTDIRATHVASISTDRKEITLDRDIPSDTGSIRLARFDAYAVKDNAISSTTTSGTVLRRDTAGYWRIGLWPQASGSYDSTKQVVWGASSYPQLTFGLGGAVNGERRFPVSIRCNEATSFSISIDQLRSKYTIRFGNSSITGNGSPFPIALVVEMQDGASISDVTILENPVTTPDAGAATAISSFTTVSGLTENASAAGGTGYVAHKFEDAISDPLSCVLVDSQGYKVMPTTNRVATFFIGADETKQIDLSSVFGPDKMFLTRDVNSSNTYTSLFLVATSRAGSGIASATINWEEQ